MNNKPLNVFVSYAREDEKYAKDLGKHLTKLKRKDYISDWNDKEMVPGQAWSKNNLKEIESSEIIVLLVSPDYIANNYIHEVELKKAIEKHYNGENIIVPVIVRPSFYQSLPISKFSALPKNTAPVSTWSNQEAAWEEIATEIQELAAGIKEGSIEIKSPRLFQKSTVEEPSAHNTSAAEIKDLINHDRLEDALQRLFVLAKDTGERDLVNEALMLMAQNKSVERQITSGIISDSLAIRMKNMITDSTLNLTTQLANE